MTNFEKYNDEIKKLLEGVGTQGNIFGVSKDNKIIDCTNLDCDMCKFQKDPSCQRARLKWLFEEAEKTREDEINEITCKYQEMCRSNSCCAECYYDRSNCMAAFTYDYLKEKENKQ